MQGIVLSSCVLFAGILLLTFLQDTESTPLPSEYSNDLDDTDMRIRSILLADLISNLDQKLLTNEDLRRSDGIGAKRNVDFGFLRGQNSGTQYVKQKMALEKAKNPWGPGRKRRSLAAESSL